MLATGPARVLAALDLIEPLGTGQDRAALAALRDRLRSARLRVIVAGEAKRGKSTLINALLGRQVLPAGVTPLTAVATTVMQPESAHAAAEGIEVAFADGAAQRFPLAALADYGTERGNPGNRRGVAAITAWLDAPVLRRGVEIVDTPGMGSVHAHNTAAAELALPTMDAAIFVLTADPPASAAERDLLRRVVGMSVAVFVVLNKADYLDPVGLAEARDFTAQVAEQAIGRPVRVYPLSARAALGDGGDPGFAAFAADFQAYLDASGSRDLERSAIWQVQRLTQLMLDEVMVAERAALLPGAIAAEQAAAFTARLSAVADHAVRSEVSAEGQSRRLLADLNAAADEARPRLIAATTEQVASMLDHDLAAAGPAEIERQGRACLARLITPGVEQWRQEQADRLEAGLRRISRQLTGELLAELTAVREAAAELLGLELTLPATGLRLEPDRSFFYNYDERVDQAELLAGALRRHLPGQAGRRLARRHLAELASELMDRQLGRARADLQYRLAEATRRLLAEIRDSHLGSTERLTSALERAAQIRSDATGEADRQVAELAERACLLRQVLGLLG
ncbi:MAG: dynamin family protein [Streptosporangiaceae bacterium]